jgi:hypothetical protein
VSALKGAGDSASLDAFGWDHGGGRLRSQGVALDGGGARKRPATAMYLKVRENSKPTIDRLVERGHSRFLRTPSSVPLRNAQQPRGGGADRGRGRDKGKDSDDPGSSFHVIDDPSALVRGGRGPRSRPQSAFITSSEYVEAFTSPTDAHAHADIHANMHMRHGLRAEESVGLDSPRSHHGKLAFPMQATDGYMMVEQAVRKLPLARSMQRRLLGLQHRYMMLPQGQAPHPPQQQQQRQQQQHLHLQQQQQQQQNQRFSSSLIDRQARLAAAFETDDDEPEALEEPVPFPLSLSSLLSAPPPVLPSPSRQQQQQQRRHHHLIFLPGTRNIEPGRTSTSQAPVELPVFCTAADLVQGIAKKVDQARKGRGLSTPSSSSSAADPLSLARAPMGTRIGAIFARLVARDARKNAREVERPGGDPIEAQTPERVHCRGCEMSDCNECNPVSPTEKTPPRRPAEPAISEDDPALQAVRSEMRAMAWTRRHTVSGCFSLQAILAETGEQDEVTRADIDGRAEEQFSRDRRSRLLARSALGDHRNLLGPIAEARRYFPTSQ